MDINKYIDRYPTELISSVGKYYDGVLANKFNLNIKTIRKIRRRLDIESHNSTHTPRIYHCSICGKEVKRYKLIVDRFNGVICSNKCRAKWASIHNTKYHMNEDFFNEWDESMAYVLGYWFADGNMSKISNGAGKKISITSKDKEILVKIRHTLSSSQPIYYDKIHDCYTLVACREKLWDGIYNLGGRPAKSLINKFPNVPNKFKSIFIRGYFDGDGSIYLSKTNYPTICFTGCGLFLKGISKYFSNIHSSLTKKSNSPVYDLRFRGRDAQQVIKMLYEDSNNIKLDRKYKLSMLGLLWDGISYNKWSDGDISTLLFLRSNELSNSRIAEILGRSYGAVCTKVYRL